MCPPLAARTSRTPRSMFSTSALTLLARTVRHALWTAWHNSASLEEGRCIPRAQIDIWSQTCSIGFISGLIACQSMTMIILVQKYHHVTCYMWWIQGEQVAPLPWWIAPQTMTDVSRFPWVSWIQASISLSLCLRRTGALPSQWYRDNLDSSLTMQCLQWRRSQTRCL